MSLPKITNAGRPATYEVEAYNELGEMVPTSIAGEHPLTLYLDKRELVTLMTLGQAPEALAIGYLRNQRLVGSVADIAEVQVDWETDSVAIVTNKGKGLSADALEARLGKRTVTTGCGQGTVFGGLMDEIDSIRLREDVTLEDFQLFSLIEQVRKYETIYKQAGAVHGCALAKATPEGAEIMMFVEDVGRHNAVDAIAGLMWLGEGVRGSPQDSAVPREGVRGSPQGSPVPIDGSDKIFYTTGRLTSEMVIKCAQMGIPFLVSRSGLTKMGHDIAGKIGITMLGRASGRHYLLFTGAQRIVRTAPRPTAYA